MAMIRPWATPRCGLCWALSLWGADMNYGVITAEVSFLNVASSADFSLCRCIHEYTFKEEGGMNYLERSGSLAVLISRRNTVPMT